MGASQSTESLRIDAEPLRITAAHATAAAVAQANPTIYWKVPDGPPSWKESDKWGVATGGVLGDRRKTLEIGSNLWNTIMESRDSRLDTIRYLAGVIETSATGLDSKPHRDESHKPYRSHYRVVCIQHLLNGLREDMVVEAITCLIAAQKHHGTVALLFTWDDPTVHPPIDSAVLLQGNQPYAAPAAAAAAPAAAAAVPAGDYWIRATNHKDYHCNRAAWESGLPVQDDIQPNTPIWVWHSDLKRVFVPSRSCILVPVRDNVSYMNYFNELTFGRSHDVVKQAMIDAGLNSAFLDTPDALIPSTPIPPPRPSRLGGRFAPLDSLSDTRSTAFGSHHDV
jgi:hypothetical protein